MSISEQTIFVTQDQGLLAHWRKALQLDGALHLTTAEQVPLHLPGQAQTNSTAVWLDMESHPAPIWTDAAWIHLLGLPCKWIAASSSPSDAAGIEALDAGCSAYCHAYSDAATLTQVQQVVTMGQIWIGKGLMQRLISAANRVAPGAKDAAPSWSEGLTQREVEIAALAANGASNLLIASECGISERTVKAHLSAVFSKLNITDRLQLALRVHGIS